MALLGTEKGEWLLPVHPREPVSSLSFSRDNSAQAEAQGEEAVDEA